MAEESKFIPNPDLFSQLAHPYENRDLANDAIEGFHKELSELRRKYKVTNFAAVMNGKYKCDDGDTAEFMIPFFFGDQNAEEAICAWLLGKATNARQERIHKMMNFIEHPERKK